MSTTKLTLTLKKEIIDQAKRFASEHGQSLSVLVENYFKYLTQVNSEPGKDQLSPRIKKLKGVIKVDQDFDYRAVLKAMKAKRHGS